MSWRQGGLHSMYFCLLNGLYVPSVLFLIVGLYIRKQQLDVFTLCIMSCTMSIMFLRSRLKIHLYNKVKFVNLSLVSLT